MEDDDEDNAHWWMISRRDADTIKRLRDHIWSWRRFNSLTPTDVIAISTMVHAMSCILNRTEFRCCIGLMWTQRGYNEDSEENERDDGITNGSSCSIGISETGIELTQLLFLRGNTLSESTYGLTRDGGFDPEAVKDWIKITNRFTGSLTTDILAIDDFFLPSNVEFFRL